MSMSDIKTKYDWIMYIGTFIIMVGILGRVVLVSLIGGSIFITGYFAEKYIHKRLKNII